MWSAKAMQAAGGRFKVEVLELVEKQRVVVEKAVGRLLIFGARNEEASIDPHRLLPPTKWRSGTANRNKNRQAWMRWVVPACSVCSLVYN
jgi:hypothetical protein